MSKKTTYLPIKSVLTSSAQTATLCGGRGGVPDGLHARIMEVLQNSNVGYSDKAVIEIMYNFGLRISEVLQINSSSVNSRNQIVIKGLKGSSNRLITPVMFSDYWQKVRLYNCKDHSSPGRFYYYRLFRKLGFISLAAGNEKNSVTHFFRHNFVTEIMKETENIEIAKELIGHKNSNSTKYYDDEQRKQSETKRSSYNKRIRHNGLYNDNKNGRNKD